MREQRLKRALEAMLARTRRRRSNRVVVLCYHSIDPFKPFASATPALFEQHLAWLAEHCTLVPYASIATVLKAPRHDRPIVAVTFDDGYDDNHTHALPLLLRYGVPATVFVTPGLLEGDASVVHRLGELWGDTDGVRGMSWSQVTELQQAGVSIGAHTMTHPNLTVIPDAAALSEIMSSKDVIESHLGVGVETFAYPFGRPRHHVSARTILLAQESGFRSAATIVYRGARTGDDSMAIPRFPVTSDPIDVLAGKICGALDPIGLWQEHSPLWLSRLVSNDPARAAD